uniref:Uncharacterized protein n=1 Tax=Gopherus agassizii TaxID=38772 RepID=A0A452HBI7_9SAUR
PFTNEIPYKERSISSEVHPIDLETQLSITAIYIYIYALLQSEMQLQDQLLLEKLLQLHASMQELKVECAYWESSDPSRETIRARARSSSEDMGAPVPTGGSAPSLKGETSRRNSIP